jgi:uncharacterized repeat protein (TIGR01451 family)
MNKFPLLLLFLLSFSFIYAENDPNQWLTNQKISFTENKGQITDKGKVRKDIFYVVQGKGVKVYFTKKGLIYNYIQTEETFFKNPKNKQEEDKIRKEHPEQIIRKGKVYGMELLFENASDKLTIKSEEETGETSNYYLPHCPDGITGVKSYQKIIYENIYENIDLVFYSNEQGLKYDFIVKPGGKVDDIKLRYKDIDKIKLLNNGNLEITNPLGKLTENKPFSYQNNKQEIKSNYILKGRTISFQIDNYDKSKNLIIDPSIVWSTYYGGNTIDEYGRVETDIDGNIYLSGDTWSTNEIAYNGFDGDFNGGWGDVFLVKFNSEGQRIWATYFGGEGQDLSRNLTSDYVGNIYVVGNTFSETGIAYKGFKNQKNESYDAFLVKFSSSGQRLWATYYGGDQMDTGSDVVVDKSLNVYLSGFSNGSTGLAHNGFQNSVIGDYDSFIVKFNESGTGIWGTYFGGLGGDWIYAMDIDNSGNIIIAGHTSSSLGLTYNGFDSKYNNMDSFIAKITSSCTLVWSTYFGGEDIEFVGGLDIDSFDNIYIAGVTKSSTEIAYGGFKNLYGDRNDAIYNRDYDAFLAKFDSHGARLWSTYYGDTENDNGTSVVVDKDNNVILAGYTNSTKTIEFKGFQKNILGFQSAFLAKFDPYGKRMWGTYLGESAYANSITIDQTNTIYIGGHTYSSNSMGINGFKNSNSGERDCFLAKIVNNNIVYDYSYITGFIFEDKNSNCLKEPDEKGIANIPIMTTNSNYYGISDSTGKYIIVVDTGHHKVSPIIQNLIGQNITQTCLNDSLHNLLKLSAYGDTVSNINFGNQLTLCSHLQTSITSNRQRRCFLNNTYISYSNTGFAKGENVKVYVKLPEYVVLKKADKSFTRDNEGNYVFSIGSLEVNQSGVIYIQDSVVCKSGITGLTACTKAWITPANNCKTPSTNWDKSDIVLSGKCIDNGRVRIVLKNMGEGNMADSSQMRLYLNASLALKKGFKINKGDSLVLSIPANGRTVRLEADQRVDHPRKSSSNITFEGCVANLSEVVSKGFVNQFPQDDTEPEVSMDCQQIRDSYDPNDKIVEPEGTTANHYTPTDAELKYLIRFQNTGTDTAYTVTVIDTLSDNLDIATLQLGSSSHKYSFNLSGKGKPVLTWTFNKINLPDSTKNKLASNGFVAFSIKPKTGLAEKTRIENYADIIFDFNDPVRTNTTFNTIYDVPPVVESSVKLDEKTVIIPKPTITSFSPEGNYNGQQVIITGTNFESKPTDNIVKFNDLIAQVVSGNTTQLVVIVPQGATKGKISVTTQAGTAVSANDFLTSPLAVEPTPNNLITVYPNPTEGIFTVDFGGLQVEEIMIYNALGKQILTRKPENRDSSIQINISNQGRGLYFVRFKLNKETLTKKIILSY